MKKEKEGNASQNCALVGLHVIFGFHRFNLSSFVIVSNIIVKFCFDEISKYVILSILKVASLCQNADDPQPTKNISKQKNISRTEQRYVSRTAIKVTADFCFDLLITSCVTTQYLACNSCRSTIAQVTIKCDP